MSIWNKITVMNPVQEQHLVYSYNLHKQSLDNIQSQKKAKRIDNKKPYIKPHNPNQQPYSKIQRTRDLNIDIENGSLMHKMLEINTLPGAYNKKMLEKSVSTLQKPQMTLNMPHRIKTIKRVNEENNDIHKRIKNVQSTISFKSLKKDYKQQKKYSKNITNCSRRIYNCFLFNSQNNSVMTSQRDQQSRFNQSKFNSTKTQSQRDKIQSQPYSPKSSRQGELNTQPDQDPIKEQDLGQDKEQEQNEQEQLESKQNQSVKQEEEEKEKIPVQAENNLESSQLPEELQQSPEKTQQKAVEQENEAQKE